LKQFNQLKRVSIKKLIFLINNPQLYNNSINHKSKWVKEPREKELLRESRRKPILFSKRDQETSDLVITSSQPEILPDLSNGQNTSHSKDKKEFFSPDLKSQPPSLSSQEPYKEIKLKSCSNFCKSTHQKTTSKRRKD